MVKDYNRKKGPAQKSTAWVYELVDKFVHNSCVILISEVIRYNSVYKSYLKVRAR